MKDEGEVDEAIYGRSDGISWTPEADVRQFLEVFGTPEDLLLEGVNATDVSATADSGVHETTTGHA